MTFSEKVIKLKDELSYSNLYISKAAKIPNSTLADIINGKTEKISIQNAISLAKVLDCSLEYLIYNDISDKYYGLTQNLQPQIQKVTNDLTTDEQNQLDLYRQLDLYDKGEIRGEMKQMLKADKYREEILEKNA